MNDERVIATYLIYSGDRLKYILWVCWKKSGRAKRRTHPEMAMRRFNMNRGSWAKIMTGFISVSSRQRTKSQIKPDNGPDRNRFHVHKRPFEVVPTGLESVPVVRPPGAITQAGESTLG